MVIHRQESHREQPSADTSCMQASSRQPKPESPGHQNPSDEIARDNQSEPKKTDGPLRDLLGNPYHLEDYREDIINTVQTGHFHFGSPHEKVTAETDAREYFARFTDSDDALTAQAILDARKIRRHGKKQDAKSTSRKAQEADHSSTSYTKPSL